MTILLLVTGMALILALEWTNTMTPLPWQGRLLSALFQSMTARTAGFNTLDIAHLTSPTLFIIMLLMVVGASPGSTGGGIKTTTTAILLALVRGQAFGRQDVEIGRRHLPAADVAHALATAAMYVLTLIIGVVTLLAVQGWNAPSTEIHDDFMRISFEAISALSTVGLSMDYSPQLNPVGRLVVVALMLCGRLGPISVILAFVGSARGGRYAYPEESVMTGQI